MSRVVRASALAADIERVTAVSAPRSRHHRALAVTAVFVLGVCLAMVGFALASLVLPGGDQLPDRPSVASFVSLLAVIVAFPSVGAILGIRRPTNPIGWLFLVTGFGVIVGVFATEYVGRVVYLGAPFPGATLLAWLGQWMFGPAVVCAVTLVPLLFPTGHVLGPRWRPVLWAALVTVTASGVGEALRPGPIPGWEDVPGMVNPFGLPGAAGELATFVAMASMPAFAVVGVASITSMIVRFRRSRSVERAQIKWPLFATISLLVALVVAVVTQLDPAFYIAMLAAASIPVAAGIAILRYRLYEIDRIVSRTIGWAIVTGMLVTVFLVVVVALQALLASVTDENTIAVAASTLVAFALFQPVRRRVQRAVDHRFDRARYDGQQVVDAFGERLRHEVDVNAAHVMLVATASEIVRPQAAGVWLRIVRNASEARVS